MKRAVAGLLLAACAACAKAGATVPVRFSSETDTVRFRAEVADSAEEQQRGLMGRTKLGAREGLLFVWDDVAERTFWMKDTLIGLDLVSIRAGRVVGLATMVPCRAEPCPITRTPPVDAALEVSAGEAAKAGIAIGDLVEAPALR